MPFAGLETRTTAALESGATQWLFADKLLEFERTLKVQACSAGDFHAVAGD
jgi:hypothetical protein